MKIKMILEDGTEGMIVLQDREFRKLQHEAGCRNEHYTRLGHKGDWGVLDEIRLCVHEYIMKIQYPGEGQKSNGQP